MTSRSVPVMEVGKKYLVRYTDPVKPAINRNQEMTVSFLGNNTDGSMAFSGRPYFGTVVLRVDQIQAATETKTGIAPPKAIR